MKRNIFLLAMLSIIFIYGCGSEKAIASSSSIEWQKNFNEALKMAKKEKKPIMLDLYTDWCGWCKELDKRTFVDKDVVQKSKLFIPLKINAEVDAEGPSLVEKYNVQGYPAILFIDSDGTLLTRVNGFIEGPGFVPYMDKALVMPAVISEIKKGNDNNIESIDYYTDKNEVDKAYIILDDMVNKGTINYIDGRSENISDINKNVLAEKYFNLASKYMYDLGDLESAKIIYEKIIADYDDSIYIYDADLNILNFFNINGDVEGLKNYINNIALKRKNLPQEYKDFYEKLLVDL